MKEFFTFQARPEVADLLSGDPENPACGTKKVTIRSDDPKLNKLRQIWDEERSKDEWPFIGWSFYRKYSAKEIASAELFRLLFDAMFEPPGEKCGTIYDESKACKFCGDGGVQVSVLCLNERKIPKRKDITRTIADEWIVSKRFAEMCSKNNITGIAFDPIIDSKKDHEIDGWYHINTTSTPLTISPAPRTGINPFDDDVKNEYRCPLGHVIGVNILSEIAVEQPDFPVSDWNITMQKTGHRGGLLRPKPSILISPKLRNLMVEEKIKGFKTEIAHLA